MPVPFMTLTDTAPNARTRTPRRRARASRSRKCGYERRKDSASRCVGLTIGASRPADQLADRALEAARSARPRCPSQCAAARSLPSADHHPRKAAAATRSSPTTSITAAVRHPSRPTCGRQIVHLWRRSTSRMRFGTPPPASRPPRAPTPASYSTSSSNGAREPGLRAAF